MTLSEVLEKAGVRSTHFYARLFSQIDEGAALDRLAKLRINYDPAKSPEDGAVAVDGHWHVDSGTTVLGQERPGPPEDGGVWATACRLAGEYEFADARILRGAYRPGGDLLGRNMLLEARFFGLRFYVGVRVTGVIDEERDTGDGPMRVASASGSSAGGRRSASTGTSRPGWLTWCARRSEAGRSRLPRRGPTASCSRRPVSGRTRWNTSPSAGPTLAANSLAPQQGIRNREGERWLPHST
jgi:hypothetical protein